MTDPLLLLLSVCQGPTSTELSTNRCLPADIYSFTRWSHPQPGHSIKALKGERRYFAIIWRIQDFIPLSQQKLAQHPSPLQVPA